MIISKSLQYLVYLIGAIILCSCSDNVRFSKAGEAQASSTTEIPASGDPTGLPPGNEPGDGEETTPGGGTTGPSSTQVQACDAFIQRAQPVVGSVSMNDFALAYRTDAITIDSARSLSILQYSGPSLTVNSVQTITEISEHTGQSFLNAGLIESITEHRNGLLCIVSDRIGVIDGVSGILRIKTNEIQELKRISSSSDVSIAGNIINVSRLSAPVKLSVTSIENLSYTAAKVHIRAEKINRIDRVDRQAIIHLYGAQVGIVTGNIGLICLHEGAAIASPNGPVSSNCPSEL